MKKERGRGWEQDRNANRNQDRHQDRYQDRGKYVDILFLPHPVSQKHPPMDRSVRAAQFSPFAALTGYDAAIRETGRRTDRFVELEEYERSCLNQRLQQLRQQLMECQQQKRSEYPVVTITYFQPDDRKDGGSYVQISGAVRRVDEQRRVIVMAAGQEIWLDHIRDITEIECFEKFRTNMDSKQNIIGGSGGDFV